MRRFWRGLSAAFLLSAALLAGAPLAQAQNPGQQPGCPLQIAPKISSAATYRLTSADRCDLVVLSNTGSITVQLPAPGLIFSPGWSASILPINGGQVTLTGLPDQAGTTHKVNLQTSLLLSAGAGAELRVLQDMNWWASARFSGSLPDAVAHNVLTLYPPRGTDAKDGTTAWSMITPDLSSVDTSGTCSSGFNEAEALAYQKGWPIEVHGDGEYSGEGTNPPHHDIWNSCSGGFVLKPLANRYAGFYSLQMQCIGGANKGCFNVDSMMKGALIMKGAEIVVGPTVASTATCGVLIAPLTALPAENLIVITDSEIEVGNVSIQPGSGTARAAVCFNVFGGSIVANRKIKINEANGGGANNTAKALYDVAVFGADTGAGSFAGNLVEVGHPHSAQTAAILIGENTTNASRYGGNRWQIGYDDPSFTGSHGVISYGSKDKFTIGLMNNAAPYGSIFFAQEGAQQNTVDCLNCTGSSDASGLNPGFTDHSGVASAAVWLNSYYANGKPFSVLGDDGQPLSGLAPVSVTNGTVGATSTITSGVYTADGSSPTGFSINLPFTRNAAYRGCHAGSNVASANPLRLSGLTTTQISFTAAAAMAAGTQVYYQCW